MRMLTLADGTTLEANSCGAWGGVLVIEPVQQDFDEAYAVFHDADKTRHIRCDYGSEIVQEFDGYTELVTINKGTESISVSLRKAV